MNANNNLGVNTPRNPARQSPLLLQDIDVNGKDETKTKTSQLMLEKLSNIELYLKDWRNEKKEKAKQKEVVDQWRELAVIWDRFFFWVFLMILVVVTPVMFGIVPLFKPHPDLRLIDHKSGMTGH